MVSFPNLQLLTNFLVLMQMLPHNLQLTYITANVGRPAASQRDEAAKKRRYGNRIPQIPRLGVT